MRQCEFSSLVFLLGGLGISNDNNYQTIDENIRQQFESAWAAGNPQPIEALVGEPASANYVATLEELVHIELECRWKERDPLIRPQLEEYLERFEPLADSAILSRLVTQEIKLRLALGESPTAAEYQQRFPEATVEIPATDQAANDQTIGGVERGVRTEQYALRAIKLLE